MRDGCENMTERLSDDRLRELADVILGMSIHAADREADDDYRAFIDAWSAIDELHAIRTAGPLMPEAPSEQDLIDAVDYLVNDRCGGDTDVGTIVAYLLEVMRSAQLRADIRAALAKGQACSTQVPPNPAPSTPANAADGAVSREHQGNVP